MANACTLTSALRGRWYGRYGLACCPAHDDHKPSLTLADAADGRLLLSCKSGCSFQDVLSALHTLGLPYQARHLRRQSRLRRPEVVAADRSAHCSAGSESRSKAPAEARTKIDAENLTHDL